MARPFALDLPTSILNLTYRSFEGIDWKKKMVAFFIFIGIIGHFRLYMIDKLGIIIVGI